MSDSEIQASVGEALKNDGKTKKSFAEQAPVLLAFVTSVLYGMGFLVWTSYLASKGISDQSLLSTKYVLAGALLAIVAVAYYFFVWRHMAKRAVRGYGSPKDMGKVFRVFLDTYFVGEDAFACCFVSAWLTGFLCPDVFAEPAQIVLLLGFTLDRFLFGSKIVNKRPRLTFAISFLLQGACMAFFFLFAALYPPLLSLFFTLLSVTIVGQFILTSSVWKSKEDHGYSIFYLGFMMLVGVVAFGATFYEHVSPKYGGAAPARVSVTLAPDAEKMIRDAFSQAKSDLFLIVDSDSATVFRLGSAQTQTKVVRLDHKLIQAIFVEPPPQKTAASLRFGEAIGNLLKGRHTAPTEKGAASGAEARR